MSTKVIGQVICSILVTLVLLYALGRAVIDTREETKQKIVEAVEECYRDNYSILGPARWEIIDCIENVEL